MAKPKVGETRGWNSKTNTGYKWNGKKWVQYRNGKPLGPFKGHGGITGNVDVVGGITSRIKNAPSRWKKRLTAINRKAKEAKERRKREGVGEFKDPKEKEKLKAKNEAVTSKKKPTTTPTKKPATTPKKSEALKAKPKKKMHSIEKRNRQIHGDETIDALKKKHAEFKAKRKAGTHRKPTLTRAQKLKKRTGR